MVWNRVVVVVVVVVGMPKQTYSQVPRVIFVDETPNISRLATVL